MSELIRADLGIAAREDGGAQIEIEGWYGCYREVHILSTSLR